MKNQLLFAACFVGIVTLSGCVSPPPTVKANLPLVNPAFASNSAMPTTDEDDLSVMSQAKAIPELTVRPRQPIILEGKEYDVSESYTSALGLKCYRLIRTGFSGAMEIRPVCDHQSYWLLYPALVISNT